MAGSISYFGVTYDANTDWRAFLRNVLSGGAYAGLNIDRHVGLSVPNALGELSETLRGTPMEIGLANAALEVIEHGDEEERLIVESAGWEKAPNAFERMLALVEKVPPQLSPLWTFKLFCAMFRLNPTDVRMLSALSNVVRTSSDNDRAEYAALAASYNLEWLIEHLSSIRPPRDADMWSWLANAGKQGRSERDFSASALDEKRARLLDAISRLGEPYVEALLDQLKRRPMVEHMMRAVRVHPVFGPRVGN